MRFLTLALAGAVALTFVSLTAEPVRAVGLCADESGHNGNADLYNNMGPQPSADCDGVFCYGYSGNGNWNSCIPPLCVGNLYNNQAGQPSSGTSGCHVASSGQSSQHMAICVIGDAYNTGGSPCEGVVCTGYSSMYGWQTCYPELGCWPQCGVEGL